MQSSWNYGGPSPASRTIQRRSPADYLRRRFLKLLLGDCVLVEPLRLSCCASRRSSLNFASSPAGPPENLSVIPLLPGLRSVDMAMIQDRGPWNRTSPAPLYAPEAFCRAEMTDSSGVRRQRRHGTTQGDSCGTMTSLRVCTLDHQVRWTYAPPFMWSMNRGMSERRRVGQGRATA